MELFYDYIKSWDVVLVYFERNPAANGFLDDYDKSKKIEGTYCLSNVVRFLYVDSYIATPPPPFWVWLEVVMLGNHEQIHLI